MIFKSYETHRGPVTQYLFSKDQEDNIEKTVPLSFAWEVIKEFQELILLYSC